MLRRREEGDNYPYALLDPTCMRLSRPTFLSFGYLLPN